MATVARVRLVPKIPEMRSFTYWFRCTCIAESALVDATLDASVCQWGAAGALNRFGLEYQERSVVYRI